MLSVQRYGAAQELIRIGRDLMWRMRDVPRLDGVAGAPYVNYYGEVSEDSDGPFEWAWPVKSEEAEEFAARFTDLTLRVEPGHEEAFVELKRGTHEAQVTVAMESLRAWTNDNGRLPIGPVRLVYLRRTPPDFETGPDTDFVLPLRPAA